MTTEFKCRTRFWESQESQWNCECNPSGFYKFQGVTEFRTSQVLSARSHECYGMSHKCYRKSHKCYRTSHECYRMSHECYRMSHECYGMSHECYSWDPQVPGLLARGFANEVMQIVHGCTIVMWWSCDFLGWWHPWGSYGDVLIIVFVVQ